MVASSDSKITEQFPHKTISPIVGQPTYDSIKELHMKLNENAVTVHSNLGNGQLGYLGVTVTAAVYNTLSTTPFTPPANPGVSPVFPDNLTGNQISNIRQVFDTETASFNKYTAVCNAILAQIIAAVHPMYLAALRLPYIGLGTRTPLQLLAHLYSNYAKITPVDLDKNDAAMKQPVDVNQPIEIFFQQIDDCMEFAAAGKAPYTKEQILNTAYQLIFRTGIFSDECKAWKKRDEADKTWTQFKIDFAIAYQDYNDNLETCPAAAGFHAEDNGNYHTDTIDAIANLATATAADRTAVANLTTTNSILSKDLSKANEKLVTALLQITTLTKQLSDLRSGTRTGAPVFGNPFPHYCWMCGYRCAHSSSKCPCPTEGHQKGAKASDTMGGSSKNRPT